VPINPASRKRGRGGTTRAAHSRAGEGKEKGKREAGDKTYAERFRNRGGPKKRRVLENLLSRLSQGKGREGRGGVGKDLQRPYRSKLLGWRGRKEKKKENPPQWISVLR